MLNKNLFKKVTSAVLAMFFLFSSVASACSASNSPKKRPKAKKQSSWMNQRPQNGNSRFVDLIKYDYDEDECYPEEDYEYKKWEKSALNDNNYVTNFEEEKEEWTPNGYRRVGDYLSTTEEENNNLNENDDHIDNAEGNGTHNVNTATNNNNQNNPARSQNAGHRGYQESWSEIVFSDDNNE